MTTSAREAILASIAGKVATVTGTTSYRSREAAVGRNEGIVTIVTPEDETVSKVSDLVTRRELGVVITFIARAQVPDTTVDPYIVAAHAALMADNTLSGLAAKVVEEGTRWQIEIADLTAAAVELRYRVIYATPSGTLATLT